ncbi:MAG: class I SAM-dependent methyltransferase [Bacteroidetes bacterium]|nr:class I SAM-dependent methyltransferase [Bacteroidota bacterium]
MKDKYYHTKESVEEYIELARDVDSRGLIEKFKQILPHNSKVLEIGSGPGSDWKILSTTYRVIGSDNSSLFVDHLRTNNPGGKFIELDAITLDTNIKFEGIYSNKVLHHLKDSELVDSIIRQYNLLRPGGIVCHSFWKGEGTEDFKGMYVNYQTEKTLKKMFEDYFEILSIEQYKEFEESDSLVIIGRKRNAL